MGFAQPMGLPPQVPVRETAASRARARATTAPEQLSAVERRLRRVLDLLEVAAQHARRLAAPRRAVYEVGRLVDPRRQRHLQLVRRRKRLLLLCRHVCPFPIFTKQSDHFVGGGGL